MDSLTAHYLARELDARWRGRRVTAFALDRARPAVILGAASSPPVRIDLAARDASASVDATASGAGPLDGWSVASVSAPEDDRRLLVELHKPGKFRGSPSRRATLEVSMVPTARGVLLRDASGHRLAAAGAVPPPPAEPRPQLSAAEVADAASAGDAAALMRGRWMSGWLARWLASAPDTAAERYALVCALPEPRPSRCGDRLIPFPACEGAEPAASLIEPAPRTAAPGPTTAAPTARDRALARMRRELERATAAPRLRMAADALMALGEGTEAPERVSLADGSSAPVHARAGESAVAAAERLYREVRSMERALEALPARIEALERGAHAEHAPDERSPGRAPLAGGVALPYRSYRSSGGLEIRVGRGAAANDRLTFRESAPDEVWLHARDAGGAHVVLRWRRPEDPPARDLEEAAVLAAWHSRARGSAVVPVDWTRRRYVRKPRGAAPGLVVLTRAETIFVRPSEEEERRLRAERGPAAPDRAGR
ncbi:MAG TPA: NFACT RNA binding domain-containing protein [Gemmatimonadaceae bacterium]|nr:NFACT RNA binding domain-containing protein [Gemmatimonadaceae bacterium]